MIPCANIAPVLSRVGTYTSPPGGAPHSHRVAEGRLLFELITSGAVFPPEGEAGKEPCGAGWVFAHGPGQETVSRTEGTARYTCLVAEYQISSPAPPWPRSFCWSDAKAASTFAQEMVSAFHRGDTEVALIGALLWAQFRFRAALFERQNQRMADDPRLSAAIAFIGKHYAEPIGIADIARHVGLSASHLHARFREHGGDSPHQALIAERMRVARHKLATTTIPIKALAREVGYTNTENFCRAFKKHTGLTAALFRRRNQVYP